MSHLNLVKPNQLRPNGFKPVLVPRPEEQADTYQTAYQLVEQIEQHLASGTKHYRTKSGALLRTLDQVVNAILADNLQVGAVEIARPQRFAKAA